MVKLVGTEESSNRSDVERYSQVTQNLTAIMIFMAIGYYFTNLLFDFSAPWFIFAGLAASASGSYLLFKLKKDLAGKIFGLASFNLLIYCVSSSESPFTNVNLYFVTAGITALILFNHKERIYSYFSVALSLALYLTAKYISYSPLAYRDFTPRQIEIIWTINLVAFVGVSAYLIVLLLESNTRKKKDLQDQNKELIKLNSELDKFIYSSSHDLRAPLSSLLGLIRLTEIEQDEKSKLEYLQMMKKRIQTMDSFIKDLIDYSKNVRQNVVVTEFSIRDLAEEVHQELKYMDGAESLTIDFSELSISTINSDINRLKIVFSNMISNAIKYRNKSKENSILTFTSSMDPKNIVIDICDDGIGIPEEHLDKVFNMFHRAHENSIGSGLGLYIVQETLATLKGKINVTSKVGEGSKFSIILPHLN